MSPKSRKNTGKTTKKKATKTKRIRTIKKRVLKTKAHKPKAVAKKPKEKNGAIGVVTHYFPKVRAAVIKLKTTLSVGDRIRIKGHTTDFTQNIASMQIDRVAINQAKQKQEIGVLVDSRVRQHDIVYKA